MPRAFPTLRHLGLAPVFTLDEARARGVNAERLRRNDVRRIGPRLYALVPHRTTSAQNSDLAQISDVAQTGDVAQIRELDVVHAWVRADETTIGAGVSAARIWGLELPPRLSTWSIGDPVTLASTGGGTRRARSSGAEWMRRRWGRWAVSAIDIGPDLRSPDLAASGAARSLSEPGGAVRGPRASHAPLRLTSPCATWTALADELELEELVIIADQLLRGAPPAPDALGFPCASRDDLEMAVQAASGRRGIEKLRRALTLASSGTRSSTATRVRLACRGLPAQPPLVGVPVWGEDEFPFPEGPDLQWPELRVCVQIDDPQTPPHTGDQPPHPGSTHGASAEPEKMRAMCERLRERGWIVARVGPQDLLPTHQLARSRVARALADGRRRLRCSRTETPAQAEAPAHAAAQSSDPLR